MADFELAATPAELRTAIERNDWTVRAPSHLDRALALARDLARSPAIDLDLYLDRPIDLARARALASARDRAIDLAIDLARVLASALASDLDLARDRARDRALASALDRASDRASDLVSDLVSDLALARGLARSRGLVRVRARELADSLGRVVADNPNQQALLELFDWVGSIVFGLVAFAHADGTNEAPSGKGLAPSDEVRLTAEDVATVIERGVATDAVDDERIRLYQRWLAEAGLAEPDVVEFLERKLIGELPQVLNALGDGKPSAAAAAIEAAAEGRSHREQLEALSTSFEQSADEVEQLAEAASRIDPDAEPFTPKALGRFETFVGRLGATLERLNGALEYLRTKAGNTGKRFVSMSHTAAGLAGGVAAAGAASSAGLPVDLTGPGSIAGVLVARWLYARRRVEDPSLPPALPGPANPDDRLDVDDGGV